MPGWLLSNLRRHVTSSAISHGLLQATAGKGSSQRDVAHGQRWHDDRIHGSLVHAPDNRATDDDHHHPDGDHDGDHDGDYDGDYDDDHDGDGDGGDAAHASGWYGETTGRTEGLQVHAGDLPDGMSSSPRQVSYARPFRRRPVSRMC